MTSYLDLLNNNNKKKKALQEQSFHSTDIQQAVRQLQKPYAHLYNVGVEKKKAVENESKS